MRSTKRRKTAPSAPISVKLRTEHMKMRRRWDMIARRLQLLRSEGGKFLLIP